MNLHHTFGHPSRRVLKRVLNKCNKRVFRNVPIRDDFVCEAYQLGKSKLLPFQLFVSHSSLPLKLVHTNIWGQFPLIQKMDIDFT